MTEVSPAVLVDQLLAQGKALVQAIIDADKAIADGKHAFMANHDIISRRQANIAIGHLNAMRGKPEAVSAKLQDAWVILEAKYNETQRCLKTGAANIAGHEGDNPWDPRTDGTV